jgi:hypothetical protein
MAGEYTHIEGRSFQAGAHGAGAVMEQFDIQAVLDAAAWVLDAHGECAQVTFDYVSVKGTIGLRQTEVRLSQLMLQTLIAEQPAYLLLILDFDSDESAVDFKLRFA